MLARLADVGACALAAALVATDNATIHDGIAAAIVDVSIAAVLMATVISAVTRSRSHRTAPLLAVAAAGGLARADSDRLAVVAFAVVALVPLAAVWALDVHPPRPLVATLAAATVATTMVRIILRDPFRELRCAPACVANPFVWARRPGVVAVTERALAALALSAAVLAVVQAVRRRVEARVLAATGAIVGVVALWSCRLLAEPRPAPHDVADQIVVVGVALVAAAVAMLRVVPGVGVALTRRRNRRFAKSIAASGDLDALVALLRATTGDRSLTVRLGVTAVGRDRAALNVVRGGEVVATVEHNPRAAPRVAAAITPAVGVALHTQRLLADTARQLDELRTTRALAVARADDARRHLERDLHDGAQQRLLSVGMQLAHAASSASSSAAPVFAAVAREVGDALGELRRIGRGDAAVVAELGVEDSIRSLAEDATVEIAIAVTRCADPDHECWPDPISTAVYRVVVGSVLAAEHAGATLVSVELRCLGAGAGRSLAVHDDGSVTEDGPAEREGDLDRVAALGGHAAVTGAADGRRFRAWLP